MRVRLYDCGETVIVRISAARYMLPRNGLVVGDLAGNCWKNSEAVF